MLMPINQEWLFPQKKKKKKLHWKKYAWNKWARGMQTVSEAPVLTECLEHGEHQSSKRMLCGLMCYHGQADGLCWTSDHNSLGIIIPTVN